MLRNSDKERTFTHPDGEKTVYREQIIQVPGERPVFVFSDVPHNKGPKKVADCTQQLARDLNENKKFSYKHDEIEFYERRPDGRYDRPKFEQIDGKIYKRDGQETYSEAQVRERATRGMLYKPEEQKLEKGLSEGEWKEGQTPTGVDREEVTRKEVAKLEEQQEKRIKQGY